MRSLLTGGICSLKYALMVLTILSCTASSIQASQFKRVTADTTVNDGGWSFGVSWVDYDNDGYPDLYVSNLDFGRNDELNYLYHNNGDGHYTRIDEGVLSAYGGALMSTWADYDNDGDIDVYVPCFGQYNRLFLNNGDGTFTQSASGPSGTLQEGSMEAEWVDYDNDGQTDLFVVNHRAPSSTAPIYCTLYKSEDGSLSRQDNTVIGLIADEGNGACWGDYDNDGDRDLFWSRNNKLTVFFDNNGDGIFMQNSNIAIAQSPARYHGTWGDYDNDGDLDLYTIGKTPGPPCLMQNAGDGQFVEVIGQPMAQDSGEWTGGYWADYDNDGWLDLLVIGNRNYEAYPNRLYHNNGDGAFTRVTDEPVARDEEPSAAAAWADHDRDGDLDLFIGNVNNANNSLYDNLGNANHWLQVRLVGKNSNRSGIGAKVRVRALIGGNPIWQMRELSAKNGFKSQSELVAHFGLGGATIVDTILVEWPNGPVDTLVSIQPNRLLEIAERQPSSTD